MAWLLKIEEESILTTNEILTLTKFQKKKKIQGIQKKKN